MEFTKDDFDISNIELPKAKKVNGSGQAAHLNDDELQTLLNALPTEQWQTVFAVTYFTGARISEVLSLKVRDIQDDRITYQARNTKTKKRREAMIVPALAKVLEAYEMPAKGYLFQSNHHHAKKGASLSRQSAHDVLRTTCDVVFGEGHGISTHSFRRSFATNLAQSGVPLAKIQRLLGHKSTAMTARYVG